MMTVSSVTKSPTGKGAVRRVSAPVSPNKGRAKVPVKIEANWENGQIQSSSTVFREIPAKIVGMRGPLLLAATSFCQMFIRTTKKKNIRLNFMQVDATSEANLTAFYRPDFDLVAGQPWSTIQLKVTVDAEASGEDLQKLADRILHKANPIKELLNEHFEVDVKLDVDKAEPDQVTKITSRHDIPAYIAMGKDVEEIAHQRQSLTCYYYAPEDDDPPVLDIEVHGATFSLSAHEGRPVGGTSDGLPTPVQAFLFASLALFMKTFVMRLGLLDVGLKSLEGVFFTIMNNGVKDVDDGLDPTIFTLVGGSIKLRVVHDSTTEKVRKAFLETQSMSPSYLALTGTVDVTLDLTKL